jgi:hypothetical protein
MGLAQNAAGTFGLEGDFMRVRSFSLGFLAVAVAALLGAGAARASQMICVDSACTSLGSLGTTTTGADGIPTWTLTAPYNGTGGGGTGDGFTVNSWTAQLDKDPFVTNNIIVTNTSGSTQTFVATVLLPIPAVSYSAVINSSVGVTVTDSNGDGVLNFANSGATPVYQGTVNGSAVLSLNPSTPVSMPLTIASCPVSFPGCTATSSAGTAFFPVAPGIATQIGITLTFTLSPGDSAGLTSRFEIVPEPATLGLLGAGLAGLLALGRRRIA